MPLSLHLPVDIERAVRERAQAEGVDVETYLVNVVTEDVTDMPAAKPSTPQASSTYAERLKAWIALHPVLDHPVDDSRESIYAGRGE